LIFVEVQAFPPVELWVNNRDYTECPFPLPAIIHAVDATELPELGAEAGCPVFYLDSVTSTQDWVKSNLRELSPPFALLTGHQTSGRGRRGSPWLDEPGGSLLMSTALDSRELPFRLELLPLAVGLAVSRSVEAFGVRSVQIKWPNDVLVRGEKLCGVLVETVFAPDGHRVAVIGTGMNVEHAPFGTCLYEHAPGVDRFRVAGELLRRLLAPDFDPEEYAARDYLRGRRVRVGKVSGLASGLDDSGALLVRSGGRLERVRAGEARVEY
jgi:BirA family biotin operon repressor/biotin-[acetyl-CoA-carboxylase] ligase